MTKNKLPKSIRKHVRLEKARIRRGLLSEEEKEKAIKSLYEKTAARHVQNKT